MLHLIITSILIVSISSLTKNQTSLNDINHLPLRKKRAFSMAGGLAMGFGAYDYYNYYGDLVSDYSYDYYDWICSETSCQLCDILTSECCDPDVDVNCFLPDTCLNNPCLSGGTCITSKTIDDRPDFTCVCLPGLTGKYCQLVNDYFVGAERLAMAMLNPTAVLGGLGGLGLSIPTGPGAPPIPPVLAVLSEIQRRLTPPLVPFPLPAVGNNLTNTEIKNSTNQLNEEKLSKYPNNLYTQLNKNYQQTTYSLENQQKQSNLDIHDKNRFNTNEKMLSIARNDQFMSNSPSKNLQKFPNMVSNQLPSNNQINLK